MKNVISKILEAVVQRCSMKKMFLEISQNFTAKHLCQGLCFPVNFVKFLRSPFLTEHLRWLLLKCFVYFLVRCIGLAVVYMVLRNPAFCLFLYLPGVHFRGEFTARWWRHKQKIKCWPIRTREIDGVRL